MLSTSQSLIILLFAAGAAFIAIFISILNLIRLNTISRRYENFMSGKDAESLEDFFLDIQENVDHLIDETKKNKDNIKTLNRVMKRSYQKYGIYKYDAFEEKTGKRSFAIALLDFTNTGFVLTFQNIGESTLVYLKEVEVGNTRAKLGDEEQKALEIAMGQLDDLE